MNLIEKNIRFLMRASQTQSQFINELGMLSASSSPNIFITNQKKLKKKIFFTEIFQTCKFMSLNKQNNIMLELDLINYSSSVRLLNKEIFFLKRHSIASNISPKAFKNIILTNYYSLMTSRFAIYYFVSSYGYFMNHSLEKARNKD